MVEALGERGVRFERRPGGDRHRPVGEARHHGLEAGAAARHVGHRHQHGLAAREEVAGNSGEALAAAVLDDAGRAARVAVGRQRRVRRAGAPSSSQKGASSPRTTQLARLGRAERAQDHARLHHSVPAVALEPEGDVVGPVGRRGERPRRRAEGHAARLRAARGHEREARVLLVLPHAGHALEARRGHEQGRLRVAHPERAEPLELVGEVEPEVAAGHDGVDALHRDQVVRATAPRPRGRRARGGRAPRRRPSSSTPAAIRWPPKRVRCSEQAASPAWRS